MDTYRERETTSILLLLYIILAFVVSAQPTPIYSNDLLRLDDFGRHIIMRWCLNVISPTAAPRPIVYTYIILYYNILFAEYIMYIAQLYIVIIDS